MQFNLRLRGQGQKPHGRSDLEISVKTAFRLGISAVHHVRVTPSRSHANISAEK